MGDAEDFERDLIGLLKTFTHRRISRTILYFFLTVGAVSSLIVPSEILLKQSSSPFVTVWSIFFIIASLSCFIGSLLDRWVIEYFMIPLLAATIGLFGVALLSSAFHDERALVVPYAMFFAAFASGLVARWRDVQALKRVIDLWHKEENQA